MLRSRRAAACGQGQRVLVLVASANDVRQVRGQVERGRREAYVVEVEDDGLAAVDVHELIGVEVAVRRHELRRRRSRLLQPSDEPRDARGELREQVRGEGGFLHCKGEDELGAHAAQRPDVCRLQAPHELAGDRGRRLRCRRRAIDVGLGREAQAGDGCLRTRDSERRRGREAKARHASLELTLTAIRLEDVASEPEHDASARLVTLRNDCRLGVWHRHLQPREREPACETVWWRDQRRQPRIERQPRQQRVRIGVVHERSACGRAAVDVARDPEEVRPTGPRREVAARLRERNRVLRQPVHGDLVVDNGADAGLVRDPRDADRLDPRRPCERSLEER